MARIRYESKNFKPETLDIIAKANTICADYQAQGFDLTLRQLYYQFVSRDWLPNTTQSYNRLGGIVNDARLAGLLDWDYIVDRGRASVSRQHYDTPGEIIDVAARAYCRDLWAAQNLRVEVWVEKDALSGVIEPTCRRYDVTSFACKGYTSQSEMHAAAQRIGSYIDAGQRVVVLHLGDHDPSGLDMTRDIAERLDTFTVQDFVNAHPMGDVGASIAFSNVRRSMAEHVGLASEDYKDGVHALPHEVWEYGCVTALTVNRVALTMEQIQEYAPPPNPAKVTDSRFAKYEEIYGDESWELDALDPATLAALITDEIEALIDRDLFDEAADVEAEGRAQLAAAAERWDEVETFVAAAR